MGKASSTKKIQRAARSGAKTSSGKKRNLLFPGAIALILVVGIGLVAYARSTGPGQGSPKLGEHWHSAFGIYVCDRWVTNLSDRGPDTLGIFHTMELGYSFGKHTVGMLHTFIQNRNTFGTDLGGPDLIGGWMLEYKHTLFFPDLEWKVALGLGGTHDQGGGKIHANPGFGASYGIDLHFPVWPRFGPTLTLAGMNVTAENRHHFGAGLALGVTLF